MIALHRYHYPSVTIDEPTGGEQVEACHTTTLAPYGLFYPTFYRSSQAQILHTPLQLMG